MQRQILVSAILIASCSRPPIEGSPCPCPSAYVCTAENVCAKAGTNQRDGGSSNGSGDDAAHPTGDGVSNPSADAAYPDPVDGLTAITPRPYSSFYPDCQFQRADDGTERCLPRGSVGYLNGASFVGYLDSACTQSATFPRSS